MRLLIRSGISSDTAAEVLHGTFVTVAEQDFALPNRKQSDSRISVLTGLSRKQVARYRKQPLTGSAAVMHRNRVERVIMAWLREPEYLDEKKDPAPLPLEGRPSFTSLVEDFAGDVPVRAVLDELVRIENVRMLPNGDFRLTVRGYLPQPLSDASIGVFASHAEDFLRTMENNLAAAERSDTHLQAQVSYNHIPDEFVDEFKQLSSRLAHRNLEDLDRWLSTKQAEGDRTGGVRLGLGIYNIVAPNEEKEDD